MAILTETTLPSIYNNNDICDAIVAWGNKNNYPLQKARKMDKMKGYVGFSTNYFIIAKRLPPIPGGWEVTVESFEPASKVIALNTDKSGTINRFILKMMDEYRLEGLKLDLSDNVYQNYGYDFRDVTATGHPLLIDAFEDFIENMR